MVKKKKIEVKIVKGKAVRCVNYKQNIEFDALLIELNHYLKDIKIF